MLSPRRELNASRRVAIRFHGVAAEAPLDLTTRTGWAGRRHAGQRPREGQPRERPTSMPVPLDKRTSGTAVGPAARTNPSLAKSDAIVRVALAQHRGRWLSDPQCGLDWPLPCQRLSARRVAQARWTGPVPRRSASRRCPGPLPVSKAIAHSQSSATS
jgi:hypothetical protein